MEKDQYVSKSREIFQSLRLLGFKSLYRDGFEELGPTGFTFNVSSCVKQNKFVCVPPFDSSDMLDPALLGEIHNVAKKEVARLIAKKQQHKKADNPFVWPTDHCLDIITYCRSGAIEWKKFNEIQTCIKCLGFLKEPIVIEGVNLYVSRPTVTATTMFPKLPGYSTYATHYSPKWHFVHWSYQHADSVELPFIPFQSCYPGFRHLGSMYFHRHNHYILRQEFVDEGEFDKGLTNSLGAYLTNCITENIRKVSKPKIKLKSLTGAFPYTQAYDHLINEVDRFLFKVNALIVMFGLYYVDESKDNYKRFLKRIESIVYDIPQEFWDYTFKRQALFVDVAAKPWFQKSFQSYMDEFPVVFHDLCTSQQEIDKINADFDDLDKEIAEIERLQTQ